MKKKLYISAIAALMALFFNTSLKAEDDLVVYPSLGFFAGINFNMHSPNFSYKPDNSFPTEFMLFNQNKTEVDGSFGFIGLLPVNKFIVLSGRLGYNSMGAVFDETKNYAVLDTSTMRLSSGIVNQKLDLSVGYLEITPVIQLHNLLPLKRLYLLAGLELGIPVTKSYNLTETTYDLSGSLIGKNQNLLKSNASIPSANFRTALSVGAGYAFNLSPTTLLSPEVSIRIPMTKVSSDAHFSSWEITQIRVGVNLTFGFRSQEEEVIKEPVKNELKVDFKEVRYYDNEGRHYPLKSLRVEDVQYTELFPIIPYIFLDEGKSSPNEDQQMLLGKSERGEFSLSKLEPDAIKINKSTLDIIGTRMKENPGSELTIVGTLDNKRESKNKSLALARAEWAKQYLMDNYGINEERLNVRGTGVPDKPSAWSVEDGIEENRRIEFSSSNSKILQPLVIESQNQRLTDPNLVEFVPEVISSDSVTNWRMEISQGDKILRKNSGNGFPPTAMQWSIHPNELTNKQIPVDYRLSVDNAVGLSKDASGIIPVEYYSSVRKKDEVLPDKIISKFSLMLFDFDKSEVSDVDKAVIDKYIIPAIKFNSQVKIYGYTDRIGDEAYNQKLAEKRAVAVKEYIQEKLKEANMEVYGVGESVLIFDNDTPIGRQLSRTVQVHIVTPK